MGSQISGVDVAFEYALRPQSRFITIRVLAKVPLQALGEMHTVRDPGKLTRMPADTFREEKPSVPKCLVKCEA